MGAETEREVYRALREAQTRYTYFLLAAAGGAIAFTVNQTQGSPLSWVQMPLGAAVLAWALSFFFGCRHLGYVSATLYANVSLLQVESGTHPQTPQHPQLVAAACAGIREAMERTAADANRFGNWQFRFLVTGGVLCVAWHVLEMYIRTVR